eukprot:3370-Pleurochrysis_carterae.AAC.2
MQTVAPPRAVNSRRWIWDATPSFRNPWCCTNIGMLSGFPSTARGYLEFGLWCVMTPSYNHAHLTWRVQTVLILTGICLERPSWAGGKMIISINTNSQRSGSEHRRGGWGAPARWLKEGALSGQGRPSRAGFQELGEWSASALQ